MENFFMTCLKSLKQAGTISPSSKYLIEKIVKDIDFREGQTIVEFGTGNGCITEVLLQNMQPHSKLHSFELNTNFWQFSQEKFKGNRTLEIHNKNAVNYDQIEALSQLNSIDYFVSSLPLTLLKNEDIDILMNKIKNSLKEDGKFIQYQYSLDKFSYLKRQFDQVQRSYTMLNLPPAFVYCCMNFAG